MAQNRSVFAKIGVTGGDGQPDLQREERPDLSTCRCGNCCDLKLANINRKAEALLHKFFGSARLDLELKDRFGGQVEPREWFLVPLTVIEEAIQKLKGGTIGSFRYDPESRGFLYSPSRVEEHREMGLVIAATSRNS